MRVGTRGPGFWKLNTSILTHETFKKAFKNFWNDWQNQKTSYGQLSTWWEIGKVYMKMLVTHYCVTMQKKHKKKTGGTHTICKHRKNETKSKPTQNQ